jgi:hypothetical protein
LLVSQPLVGAQGAPSQRAAGFEPVGRLGLELAGGPALEVATAGDRESQRGIVFVPSLGIRVTSWFDYAIEGHLARHLTPLTGNVLGVVPVGLRLHTPGRTQVHVSAGAGVAWSDLAGLRGVEQRRNYLTHIGAGLARVAANGSGVTVEARLLHLSNLSSAPPNLGMEVFAVLVGYRLPR